MELKINYSHGDYEDNIIVKGDDIEEIRLKVKQETTKRGWKDEDCWSEEITASRKEG